MAQVHPPAEVQAKAIPATGHHAPQPAFRPQLQAHTAEAAVQER